MKHHKKTVFWHAPEDVFARARQPGYLKEWAANNNYQPPICDLMSIELVEVGDARAIFLGTPGECHYNPMNTVHGGFAATLIDSATGIAVMSALPEGTPWTTVGINVSFVKAITCDTGNIYCEGVVVNKGRRIIIAEAKVRDEGGKLYAFGQATCMVIN